MNPLAMMIYSAGVAACICLIIAFLYGWPAALLCLVAMFATITFCIGAETQS